MPDYDLAIKEYKALDYAQKKFRLMNLFEIFKTHSLVIPKMIPLLQEDKLTEKEILEAYQHLLEAIQTTDQTKIDQKMFDIEQLHKKIQEIRRQEELDRQKEDPEKILELI